MYEATRKEVAALPDSFHREAIKTLLTEAKKEIPGGKIFSSEPADQPSGGIRWPVTSRESPCRSRVREMGRLEAVPLAVGGGDAVRSLFEDEEGNLWIATLSSGLWRLRTPLVTSFGKPEGLDLGALLDRIEKLEAALQSSGSTKSEEGND